MKEVVVTGIYIGQLPPAEVARLKAELAETIIANFCYPRFFDYRTDSLRMRPVDRAKRQEVWLFLSSVDFTAWNRIDLMSSDFPRSIERLFIQFVQRNRSFFGEQGRKRMSDVRMLITTMSTVVAQGLRSHVTGQRQERQGIPPFGSPRQAVSWATASKNNPEPSWEQISTTTVLLQQQLQELRGEVKTPTSINEHTVAPVANAPQRRSSKTNATRVEQEQNGRGQRSNRTTTPPQQQGVKSVTTPLNPATEPNAMPPQRLSTPATPAASSVSLASPVSSAPSTTIPARKQEVSQSVVSKTEETVTPPPSYTPKANTSVVNEPLSATAEQSTMAQPPVVNEPHPVATAQVQPPVVSEPSPVALVSQVVSQSPAVNEPSPLAPAQPVVASTPVSSIPVTPLEVPTSTLEDTQSSLQATAPTASIVAQRSGVSKRELSDGALLKVGEDDIAIFEQMRHQLIIWLRVEAIQSGLEIVDQSPPQLLELLRHLERYDDTRLQVVSTLLNLSNQVIKNGRVSVLDYKQALTFHLMHTRR